MSRLDHPLSEIHAGTHLVIVLEASILKDHNSLPVIAKDGSHGIKIRFNDNKLNMDWVYWTKFSDFKKLCKATNCDPTKPIISELTGKSLWMCVKEVKTMKGEDCVGTSYKPFDYIECVNPTQKPIVSGDPCQHPKGIPLGAFVEYVEAETNWVSAEQMAESIKNVPQGEFTQEQIEMNDVCFGVNQKTGKAIDGDKKRELVNALITGNPTPEMREIGENIFEKKLRLSAEAEAKLALGKKIIAEGEGKQMTSLNEKNKQEEQEEEDIFSEAEGPQESKDNNNDETDPDWDDL